MARGRTPYLPALLVTAVVVACAAAVATLLAVSKEAEATFPGKNGRIAYIRGRGLNPDIYTKNEGGGGKPHKVTGGKYIESNPSWGAVRSDFSSVREASG